MAKDAEYPPWPTLPKANQATGSGAGLGGQPLILADGVAILVVNQATTGQTITATYGSQGSVSIRLAGATANGVTSGGWFLFRRRDGWAQVVLSTASNVIYFSLLDDGSPAPLSDPLSAVPSGIITSGVQFLGGGAAPATGVWRFAVAASGTALVTIKNGAGNAYPMGPLGAPTATALVSGNIYLYEYPVLSGVTYTVGGGTVVDGTIE